MTGELPRMPGDPGSSRRRCIIRNAPRPHKPRLASRSASGDSPRVLLSFSTCAEGRLYWYLQNADGRVFRKECSVGGRENGGRGIADTLFIRIGARDPSRPTAALGLALVNSISASRLRKGAFPLCAHPRLQRSSHPRRIRRRLTETAMARSWPVKVAASQRPSRLEP
jgi:hypothetical protein